MVDGSFFQALHRACYGSLRGGGAADSEGHLLRSYKLVAKKAVDSNDVSHRIHGAGIYANIWGIVMVNVTIYGSTMDPMGIDMYIV